MDLIVKVYSDRFLDELSNKLVYRGNYKLIKYEDKYYWTWLSHAKNEIKASLIVDRGIDNIFLEEYYWTFLFEEGDLNKITYEYNSQNIQ